MQEVTRYAEELDPTIHFNEGTTIVVVLLKIIGHFKGPIGDAE
jgi:hypothetical protein